MIYQLFPTQIFHENIITSSDKLLKELRFEAEKLAEVDEEGLLWSAENYPFGYTSYGSLDQLQYFSTTFAELKKILDKAVKKYIKTLEMDIYPTDLFMSKCWVNVMSENCHHTMHIHPLSVISGTFYVSLPKTSKTSTIENAIKFEDPRLDQFMATPNRKPKAQQKNQRFFHIQPKAGDVVLFESWTKHEVPRVLSKQKRISISFNYDWK